jgi:hypothetical protein
MVDIKNSSVEIAFEFAIHNQKFCRDYIHPIFFNRNNDDGENQYITHERCIGLAYHALLKCPNTCNLDYGERQAVIMELCEKLYNHFKNYSKDE